jgi:hypothetical protein
VDRLESRSRVAAGPLQTSQLQEKNRVFGVLLGRFEQILLRTLQVAARCGTVCFGNPVLVHQPTRLDGDLDVSPPSSP